MKLRWIVIALVAAAGCTPASSSEPLASAAPTPGHSASPAPSVAVTHWLDGKFTLDAGDSELALKMSPEDCAGTGGYSDVRSGLGVVARDGAGVVLATTALRFGYFAGSSGPELPGVGFGSCTFFFSMPNLPDSAFYSVEVGHRGAVTHSRQELDGMKWKLELTLGE